MAYLFRDDDPEDPASPFVSIENASTWAARDGLWEVTVPYYEGMKAVSVKSPPDPGSDTPRSGKYTLQILIDGVVVQEDASPPYMHEWGVVAGARAYSLSFWVEGTHDGQVGRPDAIFFIDDQPQDGRYSALWSDGYAIQWRSIQVDMGNGEASVHYENLPNTPQHASLSVSQGFARFASELRLRGEVTLYSVLVENRMPARISKVLK